jgi:hypothetical protein
MRPSRAAASTRGQFKTLIAECGVAFGLETRERVIGTRTEPPRSRYGL